MNKVKKMKLNKNKNNKTPKELGKRIPRVRKRARLRG